MNSHDWNPDLYDERHSFVWQLASPVVELLSAAAGERILDLGCGNGKLTNQIAESGAEVVGLDNSPAMIEEARRMHPHIEFLKADAHDFDITDPFDAVFSNAALHWISEPARVARMIARALKPQGRLVVEFGGKGNVRYLVEAIESGFQSVAGELLSHAWYFPSIAEFADLLESHGMEVIQAGLIDRPTVLDGDDGLRNWVRMFGGHWLDRIPAKDEDRFFHDVEQVARENLIRDGNWFADYRRIRILAHREE